MERKRLTIVLNYIEEHLKDELNIKTLAHISGYSEYHFIRVFRRHIHLTPADYIRKRRISEIVKRIGETSRPISDIAFEYGFNSKENFTRAFKTEHGILPTEWKTANCSLRLFMPFLFDAASARAAVSLKYMNRFTLVAYKFDDGSPPPLCWNRYNSEKRSIKLSGGDIVEDFGAMLWDDAKKRLIYFIGVKSDEAKGETQNTLKLEIKGGLYAVFETPAANQHNFVGIIRSTWDWIYQDWLPNSGFCRDDGFELESYVESSKKYTERIYVPIRKE